MTKKLIFIGSALAIVFSLTLMASFAKAEVREFVFPIVQEPTNLFEKIIDKIGLGNYKAEAAKFMVDWPKLIIGHDGDDAEYYTSDHQLVRVDDGGGGADDGHFYVEMPKSYVYASPDEIDFKVSTCTSGKDFDCIVPNLDKKIAIYPWQIIEASISTHKNTTKKDEDCKMNVLITSPDRGCDYAGKSGNFYGANDGFCGDNMDGVTAYLDERNFGQEPAGKACGHVRVDGGAWFSTKSWVGSMMIRARSGELDSFRVEGLDAKSGKLSSARSGQTLNICKGDSVDILWETSDTLENSLVLGDILEASPDSMGVPERVGERGKRTVTPTSDTSFSMLVKATTGEGVLNIAEDPAYVTLEECDSAPPVEHCDPAQNDEIGENLFCSNLYDEYGSRKKCCLWPEDKGEFGDGCGKCQAVFVPGAPKVNLLINGRDGSVTISPGDSVNLSWTTQDATSCVASDGWSGNQVLNGSKTINNITSTTRFSLNCSNNSGIGYDIVDAVVNTGAINLNAQAISTRQIDISWNDDFSDETGFNIYRAKGSCSGLDYLATRPAGTVKLENKYLDPGTTYCFRVEAYKGQGVLASSNEAQATTFSISSPPPPPPIEKGSIRVKVRLDGKIVSGDAVNYILTGPQSLSGSGNKTFSSVNSGNYLITHSSGLPQAGGENDAIVFQGYSPARSLFVGANKTIDFYLDFGTLATCDLRVEAKCDGSSWTGTLAYALVGPITLNGTAVSQDFSQIPSGEYYLSDMMTGPGTLESISPSNPALCAAGSETVLEMNFADCREDYFSQKYSCNLQSGRCEICLGDDIECPYSNLNTCQADCSGGGCDADAEVDCWTNYDSESCIGLIDKDASSPNIVLTSHSAGCSSVQSCKWEVTGYPEYTQNSCAPFSWYDDPGNYTAKLTVVGNDGNVTSDTQDFVVRDIDGVICDFAWSPENPTVNAKIDFFDRSLVEQGEEVVSWNWTFSGADLATSSSSIVQDVVFGSVGEKTVNLKATTDGGRVCSLSKKINIRKVNPRWWEVVPK